MPCRDPGRGRSRLAEPEPNEVRHAAAGDRGAREAVDLVGIFLGRAGEALLDADRGARLVVGERPGQSAFQRGLSTSPPRPGVSLVLVEGDADDRARVGLEGEVAVERAPESVALDRQDQLLALSSPLPPCTSKTSAFGQARIFARLSGAVESSSPDPGRRRAGRSSPGRRPRSSSPVFRSIAPWADRRA